MVAPPPDQPHIRLVHDSRTEALEEAAGLCDAQADLYAAYVNREKEAASRQRYGHDSTSHAIRAEFFERDHLTCREMARLIRALKELPAK